MDSFYIPRTNPYHPSVSNLAEYRDVQFVKDRLNLLAEPEQAEPRIRNVIVPRFDVERDGERFCYLKKPLRVTVEAHQGTGFIAHLIVEPTILGYGDTLDEAVTNALIMLGDDLSFYSEASDDNLTIDAIELREKLLDLFEISEGNR